MKRQRSLWALSLLAALIFLASSCDKDIPTTGGGTTVDTVAISLRWSVYWNSYWKNEHAGTSPLNIDSIKAPYILQVTELQNQNAALDLQVANDRQTIGFLDSELTAASAERDALLKQVDSLNLKITELENTDPVVVIKDTCTGGDATALVEITPFAIKVDTTAGDTSLTADNLLDLDYYYDRTDVGSRWAVGGYPHEIAVNFTVYPNLDLFNPIHIDSVFFNTFGWPEGYTHEIIVYNYGDSIAHFTTKAEMWSGHELNITTSNLVFVVVGGKNAWTDIAGIRFKGSEALIHPFIPTVGKLIPTGIETELNGTIKNHLIDGTYFSNTPEGSEASSFYWAEEGLPKFIILEFDKSYISWLRLSFFNYAAGREYTYTIQASLDKESWIDVVSTTSDNNEWQTHTLDVTAKYLKVNITGQNQNEWANIWEIEPYGYSQPLNQ